MAKSGGKPSKLKNGRWRARIPVGRNEDGELKYRNVTAKTEDECWERLKTLKKELGLPEEIDSHMPFGEWIDYWFREFCAPRLRASTQETYRNRIYKQIIPKIGNIPLDELKNNDLQAFYSHLIAEGRLINVNKFGSGLSNSHIRHIHSHCSAALKKAIEEGLIFKNPADGCRLPPKVHGKITILTHDELYRLLVQAKYDGMFEMLFLDITTGLRRGELVALKWSDLNIRKAELNVSRQYTRINGKMVISNPKTPSAVRTIKLTKITLRVLKGYQQRANSEWMFPSPLDATHPKDPEACGRKLKRILEKAGCRNIRFHDIRHTFATMALENGIDVKTVADILGHNTVETALDTYTHITNEMQNQSAHTIDRKFAGIRNTEENTDLQINRDYIPNHGKKRRSGTGYIKQLSPNCWQGRYSPVVDGKRIYYNIYAATEEECEKKLEQLIKEKKY